MFNIMNTVKPIGYTYEYTVIETLQQVIEYTYSHTGYLLLRLK